MRTAVCLVLALVSLQTSSTTSSSATTISCRSALQTCLADAACQAAHSNFTTECAAARFSFIGRPTHCTPSCGKSLSRFVSAAPDLFNCACFTDNTICAITAETNMNVVSACFNGDGGGRGSGSFQACTRAQMRCLAADSSCLVAYEAYRKSCHLSGRRVLECSSQCRTDYLRVYVGPFGHQLVDCGCINEGDAYCKQDMRNLTELCFPSPKGRATCLSSSVLTFIALVFAVLW